MVAADPSSARWFFGSFMFLITNLALWALLAIVYDAFALVRAEAAGLPGADVELLHSAAFLPTFARSAAESAKAQVAAFCSASSEVSPQTGAVRPTPAGGAHGEGALSAQGHIVPAQSGAQHPAAAVSSSATEKGIVVVPTFRAVAGSTLPPSVEGSVAHTDPWQRAGAVRLPGAPGGCTEGVSTGQPGPSASPNHALAPFSSSPPRDTPTTRIDGPSVSALLAAVDRLQPDSDGRVSVVAVARVVSEQGGRSALGDSAAEPQVQALHTRLTQLMQATASSAEQDAAGVTLALIGAALRSARLRLQLGNPSVSNPTAAHADGADLPSAAEARIRPARPVPAGTSVISDPAPSTHSR